MSLRDPVSTYAMSQIATLDVTAPCAKFTKSDIFGILKEWAKKWVFQQEKSDSGYEHFQIRLSLIKKRRISELKKLGFFKGAHFSPTSTTVHSKGAFNYVMKADTRVDGPWKDTEYVEPPPVTRQLVHFRNQEMYPWQKALCDLVKRVDDRKITIIHCPHGDNGKSILCEHLEQLGEVCEIPPMRSMEDIMACVMCQPISPAYVIDMPRGMKKDKLGEFYSGLETLKNGIAYDKRYAFKKRRFNRPQVFVFTNNLPAWGLMSKDRWDVFQIDQNKCLAPIDIPI